MYAKSFIALDGNGRLTGARTAQAAPYAHYTCHLCGSALRYHPQYDTELPWFEHTDDRLTELTVTVNSALMSGRSAEKYS
ncbi:hypothetical protein EIMP300_85570 [Escherichia coli]|uniref:DUF7828 domain-containing protein n=1 Tax=Escherichia coli TaxID=562 RepID=A0A8S0G4N0_ECOLX|nr:hypothetical protein EIMP300_85570 [Escherichia coli]